MRLTPVCCLTTRSKVKLLYTDPNAVWIFPNVQPRWLKKVRLATGVNIFSVESWTVRSNEIISNLYDLRVLLWHIIYSFIISERFHEVTSFLCLLLQTNLLQNLLQISWVDIHKNDNNKEWRLVLHIISAVVYWGNMLTRAGPSNTLN